jgi:protein-disulfide isomerase
MSQVNNVITLKKLAAGAGVLVAAALCLNLLLSPTSPTQIDAQIMRSISKEGTFATVLGDGSRAIHVFVSTECSFCRKIEPELDRLESVTVYRHMLPGRTAAGRLLAVDVWCARDSVKAWKDVTVGAPISPTKCDGKVLEKNLELARRLGLTTTPSIVYADGHVSAGMLSSSEIARRIAKSSPQ